MRIHVKPRLGMRVRNPEAGFDVMPPDGESVPRNQYWMTMLAEGSVELVGEHTAPTSVSAPDVPHQPDLNSNTDHSA